jgi:hypothetical protein
LALFDEGDFEYAPCTARLSISCALELLPSSIWGVRHSGYTLCSAKDAGSCISSSAKGGGAHIQKRGSDALDSFASTE